MAAIREGAQSYVIDIQRRFERGNHNVHGLDYTVFHLDWVVKILVRYSGTDSLLWIFVRFCLFTANNVLL